MGTCHGKHTHELSLQGGSSERIAPHRKRHSPYGRDSLAHSRSLSTARRALRVAEVGVACYINQFI